MDLAAGKTFFLAENYDGHLPQALPFMAYLSVPTNIVILSSKYDVVLLKIT